MAERIAIFASGSGSNVEAIAQFAKDTGKYEVAIIVTNNAEAGVIRRAQRLDIPAIVLSKTCLSGEGIIAILEKFGIGYIVLAGYLKLVPVDLIRKFKGKIVNIHPALLPSHGGKGMYGARVHEAVIACGDKESGITIHEVNEHYDEGQILFQAKCTIDAGETPDSLARKIHQLEHRHYPDFLDKWINGQ